MRWQLLPASCHPIRAQRHTEWCRASTRGLADRTSAVIVSQTNDAQQESLAQRAELHRQVPLTIGQQDRLLDIRLAGEVEADRFAKKQGELRDRLGNLRLLLDALNRSHDETVDLAAKVFELSQTLRRQWFTADYAAKRRIPEIVFLNCRIEDVTLVPTIRKHFDVLADERCVSESWGARV
jgi:site-specific DNA recombinase